MKTEIYAAVTALAVFTGSSVGFAQGPPDERAPPRVTAAELNALADARVAIVKAALQLTNHQEKYWPAIEQAIRSRAKDRETRLSTVGSRRNELSERSAIENLRDRNPVEL